MAAATFIGDEWAAAGFRLAGAEVVAPGEEDPLRLFERVLSGPGPLVFLAAGFARQIPAGRLEQARRAAHPLILVVGDPGAREPLEPLTRRVRRRMGVAE